MSVLAWRLASAERLVAAGSLTECKAAGDKRVCDGAVTKELKSTTPSVQVCDMGQLKVKNLKQVGAGAPQLGGGKYIFIRKRPVRIERNLLVQCVFPLNVLWLL